MNTNAIKIFIEVYRRQSFAEVAKAHNLVPSSVSRSISALEADLGVKLFQRTTRKVLPTEQGSSFFQKIVPLLEELEAAKEEIQVSKRKPTGVLRVTSPVSFNQQFLVPTINDFLNRYPDLKLELLVSDSTVDILAERIDVAIRFGRLAESSLITTKLCDLNYVACASPEYLRQHGKPSEPHEVEQHNCLSFLLPKFDVRWKFRKNDQEKDVKISGNISISSAISLRDLASNHLGIALLPKILLHSELKSGKLVNLFPDHEITATEFNSAVWIVYPSRDYLPLKTRVFIDFLKSHEIADN